MADRALSRDYSAPLLHMEVSGTEVGDEIMTLINPLSWETDIDLATKLEFTCENPGREISDRKIFQPGNEIDVFIDYRSVDYESGPTMASDIETYLGRVEVIKSTPDFGDSQVLRVTGYDKSWNLMKDENEGEALAGSTHSTIVENLAKKWGLEPDVRATQLVETWFTRKGVSTHKIIKGLANLHNFEYYVEFRPSTGGGAGGSFSGKWYLVWKPFSDIGQGTKYVFDYGADSSPILSFKPEFAFLGQRTKLEVVAWDSATNQPITATEETPAPTAEENLLYNDNEKLKQGMTSSILLAMDKFHVEILTAREFATSADINEYANAWFEKNKSNFMKADCKLIGVPGLKARQIHTFTGFGPQYDGDWMITKAKHVIDRGGQLPYMTDLDLRKVVL